MNRMMTVQQQQQQQQQRSTPMKNTSSVADNVTSMQYDTTTRRRNNNTVNNNNMKQRILLHTQRQRRRQRMMIDCRQLCLRITLMVTITLAILYYILSYIFVLTTISSSSSSMKNHNAFTSSSSSSSSILLSNPSALLRLQQQYRQHPNQVGEHQHQQQQQRFDEIEAQLLPSTAGLDLQYQQLRLFFVPPTVHHSDNNNDLLSDEASSSSQQKMITQKKQLLHVLELWLNQEDYEIIHNFGSIYPRYIRPYLLPPLPITTKNGNVINPKQIERQVEKKIRATKKNKRLPTFKVSTTRNFFRVYRLATPLINNVNINTNSYHYKKEKARKEGDDDNDENTKDDDNNNNNKEESPSKTKSSKNSMQWQNEYDTLLKKYGSRDQIPGPIVDYTNATLYEYPTRIVEPPLDGTYPKLQSLQQLLHNWPQNEDYYITTKQSKKIHETLQHFDYQNPIELQMAIQYRDAELPFKLYNIPDLIAASSKWNDDNYVGQMFGSTNDNSWFGNRGTQTAKYYDTKNGNTIKIPTARGTAQESRNHYFAFYVAKQWDVETMGLTPTRNIQDWDYNMWSHHARYADAVQLTHDKPHFYWQSGIPPEERFESDQHWTFITRDLPMFSTTKNNFFVFNVEEQKGIQCRFGERGVVAATHFDSGRNMVAMINGAKRYILSPPNQCSKLGIFTNKHSPIYRHSLLNFGHIELLNNDSTTNTSVPQMSPEERAWLQRAASSQAVETVLKQGEVLYIPSHWFHYIVSLQKSAQCNVRSGIDIDGTNIFGGRSDVEECTE